MCCYHQGIDGYLRHGYKNQSSNDRYYNKKFVKGVIQGVNDLNYTLESNFTLRKNLL